MNLLLRGAVTAALVLCLACDTATETPPAVTHLDLGYYQCQVQPIFDRSCAFTACHGDPGRALFTYSASKRRLVEEELIGEPLTDKELCSNYYRASVFVTPNPKESQLITKPETLDGYASQYHAGNYLFGEGDPEALCLQAWMEGASQPVGTSTPSVPCRLPWRTRPDGAPGACVPRGIDCDQAIHGPDLPEGG